MKYPNLLERFLTYVKVNTRSDETSTTTPSTQSQVDFAKNVLIPEMKRVGLENVYYLPNGFANTMKPSFFFYLVESSCVKNRITNFTKTACNTNYILLYYR